MLFASRPRARAGAAIQLHRRLRVAAGWSDRVRSGVAALMHAEAIKIDIDIAVVVEVTPISKPAIVRMLRMARSPKVHNFAIIMAS
jgi:hypothetical protein